MKCRLPLVITLMFSTAYAPLQAQLANLEEGAAVPPALDAPRPEHVDGPVIQLALLLDTSNSMDGLIDQARTRLWKIVNEMGKAEVEGKIPQVQVALFQYGNDGLPKSDDYVQLRSPFTTDLDIISEQLFSLKTDGGQEFCGAVLRESLNQLNWLGTAQQPVLRIIVIAGNEPFNQGTEPYEEWTSSARKRGVRINTIFCGQIEEGRKTLWADAAKKGGGEFAAIDQNKAEIYIETPFDDALQRLNDALNATYLGYGTVGRAAKQRQAAQDASNKKLSLFSFFSRAKTKAGSNYDASNWDLVSAVENEKVKVTDLKKEDLPENLQDMNPEELEAHLRSLAAERKRIQAEINTAAAKREKFIAEASREAAAGSEKDLDDALVEALKKQAVTEGFSFK